VRRTLVRPRHPHLLSGWKGFYALVIKFGVVKFAAFGAAHPALEVPAHCRWGVNLAPPDTPGRERDGAVVAAEQIAAINPKPSPANAGRGPGLEIKSIRPNRRAVGHGLETVGKTILEIPKADRHVAPDAAIDRLLHQVMLGVTRTLVV